jgi:hypothetical protein
MERFAQIADNVKAYKKIMRLKKELISISKDNELYVGWEHQDAIYLEMVRMTRELDEIIAKYVPKHEIPDDPKEREAMGLPDKSLLEYLVPAEKVEEMKRNREEADRRWRMRSEAKDLPSEEELREKVEKLKREFRGEDLMFGLKPDEDGAKPLTKQGANHFRVAATADPIQDPSEEDAESEPEKEQIKGTKSGTGSNDGIKGGGDE